MNESFYNIPRTEGEWDRKKTSCLARDVIEQANRVTKAAESLHVEIAQDGPHVMLRHLLMVDEGLKLDQILRNYGNES